MVFLWGLAALEPWPLIVQLSAGGRNPEPESRLFKVCPGFSGSGEPRVVPPTAGLANGKTISLTFIGFYGILYSGTPEKRCANFCQVKPRVGERSISEKEGSSLHRSLSRDGTSVAPTLFLGKNSNFKMRFVK